MFQFFYFNLRNLEEIKSKIKSSECLQFIGNYSIYHNSNSFQHLRKKLKYKISTPIHPFSEGIINHRNNNSQIRLDFNIKEIPFLNIEKVADIFNYSLPNKIEDINDFYIFNEFTAIPYLVLSSKTNEEKETR